MKVKILIIVTYVTLLASYNRSFGQAPNLNTASNFALFTSVGAVTNVGSSSITGDIGTNAGDISGFETATVTGNTRIATSPQSITAAIDVVTAYNSLNSVVCSTTIAAELGSQTLTSGVYCQTATDPTSLNGTLTLSGPGIFIIKLNSALTTATSSSIVLTNGASASNVYFQINGAATLGTGSTFKGNILAMGAIVLNTTTLEGRALSTVGAITVNESIVILPSAPTPPDLTAILYARPSTVSSMSNVTVVVDVVELNSIATNGLITVKVTKDALVSLTLTPGATMVGGRPVQNTQWEFSDIPGSTYYVLTTSDPIPAGDKLSFGLEGPLNPSGTTGNITISTVIDGSGVGEQKLNNNVDADKIDYFQQ